MAAIKLYPQTIIFSIAAFFVGAWVANQKDKVGVETPEPALAAAFDDRVQATLAAVQGAEDDLPEADKKIFGRLRKPIEALAAHSVAKGLQAEADAIDKALVDDGKKGFIITASIIGMAIVALVKKLIFLFVMTMIWKWIMAHLMYVLGAAAVFWFMVWVIAKTTAWRTALAVVSNALAAKAKVAK